MGKAQGRTRQERNLVDMSAEVDSGEPELYEPDLEGAEEGRYDVSLDHGHELVVCTHERENRMLKFSILHRMLGVSGEWFDVALIDSCHGVVHIHDYYPDGDSSTTELWPIHRVEQVASYYNDAYVKMLAEWDERRRRWAGEPGAS